MHFTGFLHATLVVLTSLTAIIAFTEVMIGDDGEKAAKERLADWYVYLGDGNWRHLTKSSAMMLDKVLNWLLGEKILSVRAVLVWCVVITVVVNVQEVITIHSFTTEQADVRSIMSFIVFDFPFLAVTRKALRLIKYQSSKVMLVAYFAIAYLGLALALSFLLDGTIKFRGPIWYFGIYLDRLTLSTAILSALLGLLWPLKLNYAIYMVPAFVSGCLLAPVMFGALIMQVFRPVMEPLALKGIERLANSKKGVLTAITALLTSITALITALTGVKV
jgi:hypothetical protein